MKKIFFVAKSRVDHETWRGTDDLGRDIVVRAESDVEFFPQVVRYEIVAEDGKAPCIVIGAQKLKWSEAVRSALFPGSKSGTTYDWLAQDWKIPTDVRARAKRWFEFDWIKSRWEVPDADSDPVRYAMDDLISPETAYEVVGGDETHLAVAICMWNAVLKDAMKRRKTVWIKEDMVRHMGTLDFAVLSSMRAQGKLVLRESGELAFAWAAGTKELEEAHDDADVAPSTDLPIGDFAACVDSFVDSKRVCCTMRAKTVIKRNPYVFAPIETVELERGKVYAWIHKNVVTNVRNLVLGDGRSAVVRVCEGRSVHALASYAKPGVVLLDGTREVEVGWAKKNVRTICVRGGHYAEAIQKLPSTLRFDKVFCVVDSTTRMDWLRECNKWGPLVVIKLKK